MKIQTIPIDDLKPNEYNPNKISEAKYQILVRNIRDDSIGYIQPILLEVLIQDINKQFSSEEIAEIVGFDQSVIDEIINSAKYADKENVEDEVSEIGDDVVIKKGDLIEMGEHRLLCGDSTNKDEVEYLMNGEKADMVFTDPPYGVNFKYNKYDDNKTREEHKKFVEKWFEILKTKSDFIIITPGNRHLGVYYNIENDFLWATWNKKPNITNGYIAFADITEPILFYGKTPKRRYNINYFEYGTDRKKDLNKKHPCPKPIKLITALIEPQTETKSTVLDIFGGSGTTLISCEKIGRKCRMMEIDEHYCQVIVERYCQYTGNSNIKINGKAVDWNEIAGE